MRYHNITPSKYFKNYNKIAYNSVKYGRKGLKYAQKYIDYSIADSTYNKNELLELGYKNVEVVPVFISFEDYKKEAIKTAASFALGAISPKYSSMLVNAVDFSKLDIKDGKITGFDEQVANFKTTYPDLFNEKGSTTPPPLPTNDGNSKVKYEDFIKMSDAEKSKLTDEQLKEILREV